MLDGNAIYKTLSTHRGIKLLKEFRNGQDVDKELKLIADDLKNIVAAQKLENLLNRELYKRINIDPLNIEESYKTIIERRLPIINSYLNEKKCQEYLKQAREEINSQWEPRWIELCPGRGILKEFCKRNIDGALDTIYPILVEQIAKNLAAEGLHFEVKEVINRIME